MLVYAYISLACLFAVQSVGDTSPSIVYFVLENVYALLKTSYIFLLTLFPLLPTILAPLCQPLLIFRLVRL